MMQTDYVDDTGRQIPVEFEEGGFISRTVSRIRGLFSGSKGK
jgi:hypothetical protein